MKKTYLAKEYSTRNDLEKEIARAYGMTADKKDAVEIKGTRRELKRLGLSGRTTFWGISCVETDPEPKKPVYPRPERGERHPSRLSEGLNVDIISSKEI